MSKLTPEQIAAAKAELAPIEAQIIAFDDIARDIRERVHTLRIERDGILARHHVDYQDCEGCRRAIIGDEKAHYYADGPICCIHCAPTFSDCEKEISEALASDDLDDSDRQRQETALQRVREIIAAGRGAEKNVW